MSLFFWRKKKLLTQDKEAVVAPEQKYEYRSVMYIKLTSGEELTFTCKSDTEIADPMTFYWHEFLDWYLKTKTAYFLFTSNLQNGKRINVFLRKSIVNIHFSHTKHEV
jgi:hypothetical protein